MNNERNLNKVALGHHRSVYTIQILPAAAVAQWVRALAPQAEGRSSNPGRDRPKSLK